MHYMDLANGKHKLEYLEVMLEKSGLQGTAEDQLILQSLVRKLYTTNENIFP